MHQPSMLNSSAPVMALSLRMARGMYSKRVVVELQILVFRPGAPQSRRNTSYPGSP